MLKVMLYGLLAGLDNLQVSSAIGLTRVSRRRQWSIVAVFAFFEAAMPLVGLLIGNRAPESVKGVAPWLGPVFMVWIALVVLAKTYLPNSPLPSREEGPWVRGRAFQASVRPYGPTPLPLSPGGERGSEMLQRNVVLIPMAFLLSLDNLVAGLGVGAQGYSVAASALAMGLGSASMCVLGLFVGGQARRLVPNHVGLATGLCLIAMAVFRVAFD